jgi:hypothetical protein
MESSSSWERWKNLISLGILVTHPSGYRLTFWKDQPCYDQILWWSFKCCICCQKFRHPRYVFLDRIVRFDLDHKYGSESLPRAGLFVLVFPTLPAMASKQKLKNVGKNIIGYPEETVPVPSSVDWVKDRFRNPKHRVGSSAVSLAVSH